MKRGHLSTYFAGVGVKTLSATEIDPKVSRGHEFQGVKPFQAFLGVPVSKQVHPATYVWLSDESEPLAHESSVTWYDSRRGKGHREPEPRFYYPAEAEGIIYRAKPKDVLFVAYGRDGRLTFLMCPVGSTIEKQLLWLFDLQVEGETLFSRPLGTNKDVQLGPTARYVLGLIGIDASVEDTSWLKKLVDQFGTRFPTTASFSEAARKWHGPVDVRTAPDEALTAWLELEELLFFTFERHLIAERLEHGFGAGPHVDVDGFVSFSLSVQNRRKSRAGYSLENHLAALFEELGLAFERGATTEGKRKPDFLFPGSKAYHDPNFPEDQLTLLGSKSSCKDRWRQVLTEGARVPRKHLVTLEPGISASQTSEMQEEGLQLVVPTGLFETYQPVQRKWLMSVADFIEMARERQRLTH